MSGKSDVADVPLNFTGKICGYNLTSKPGFAKESDYWIEWDWAGWIRKQIDYAYAGGANCIRLIGDVAMVQNGLISQALYNARTQQLLAYCVSLGISVYLTGCATYDTHGVDNGTVAMTDAQIAAVVSSNVAAVTSGANDYRANIIGVDGVQEAIAGLSNGRILNLYSLIKPNVPLPLGLTFSTNGAVTTYSLAPIIAAMDFIDYHIYKGGSATVPTPQDITDNPRFNYPNKDVFFGEGGADRDANTAQQVTDWLAGLAVIGTMSDSHVRGAMMWAVQDQQTSGEHYGAFDSSWAPRSETLLPWVAGFGTQSSPIAPATPRAANGVLLWSPLGCTTAYTGTKLYRDGSLIATQLFGRYDDSANWGAVQHKYEATALAGASESAKSAPFYYLPGPAVKSPGAGRFMMPV